VTITPRRILFWLHLIAGCIAGTVIFFLAVTGTCIAYERQMIAWADRDHKAAASGTRAPIGSLVTTAEAYAHGSATAIAIHSNPGAPVEITVGREPARVLLLDPYSGRIMGESAPRLRSFFTQATALHRWFGMKGENRTTARAIKGAFTLSLLFLICSGAVLWLPRKWTRQHVSKSLLLRRDLKGRARDWNWHNVIGIWIAAPLAIIVLTGVVMVYPWANDLLYRITGNTPPPRQAETSHRSAEHKSHGKKYSVSDAVTDVGLDMDALFALAGRHVAGWQTISLRLPVADISNIAIQVDRGDGGRPDLRTQVTMDAAHQTIQRVESFSSYNMGRKLRLWSRFTHTGEAGGIAGETIAAIVSICAAFMVWTGLSLTLRRLLAWRKRRSIARLVPASVSVLQQAE
jgi:uncharacterized iron-regulated membrane protein